MACIPSPHAKPPPAQDASSIVESLLRFQRMAAQNISPHYGFVPLDEKVLLDWMQTFVYKRGCLQVRGKPNLVEIGYHYTTRKNFLQIQKEGLKSHKGRRHFFGRGVYVANNPMAFRAYGDTGAICLVMKGVQRWCLNNEPTDGSFGAAEVDTFSGNKVFDRLAKSGSFERSSYFDEVVLRSDEQVIPIFWYDRELTNNADMIWNFHCALQAWVDATFRPGSPPTILRRPVPCREDLRYEHKLSVTFCNPNGGINPTPFLQRSTNTRFIFGTPRVVRVRLPVAVARVALAPPGTTVALTQSGTRVALVAPRIGAAQPPPGTGRPTSLFLTKPQTKKSGKIAVALEFCNPTELKAKRKANFLPWQPQPTQECSICFEKLKSNTVRLSNCIHVFHKDCLKQALKHKSQCPVCRNLVGEPIGCSPPGTMTAYMRYDISCGGYPQSPTYDIRYNIPAGTQAEEHENPGVNFRGTTRVAYIPATQQGRNLLARLCYAFRRGLTFRVGTSLTSGLPNSVCWASVHHKTNLKGGSFGWPDPNYFANVNEELDHLKVPKAQDLLASR